MFYNKPNVPFFTVNFYDRLVNCILNQGLVHISPKVYLFGNSENKSNCGPNTFKLHCIFQITHFSSSYLDQLFNSIICFGDFDICGGLLRKPGVFGYLNVQYVVPSNICSSCTYLNITFATSFFIFVSVVK